MKCSIAVLTICWLTVACFGQSSGIQGIATDESRALVPSAKVTVTNVATGVSNTTETNEQGFYTVPFLGPGSYRIEVSKSGFAPVTRDNLQVYIGQIVRADFVLKVGDVSQRIEVSATAALLDSETSTTGQVIENKRIVEMPLNKRNYLELARLSAGVVQAATMSDGARTGQTEAGFVGMGMRAYQTSIMIDGVDNTSRSGGGPLGFQAQATKPSVDAVGEFKVVTSNMSAEFGYRMGPTVMVSIKSGTNAIHGSLYEFLRNEKLDGSNFFANRAGSAKPTLRQNQFGGTVGGPIIKDRTFYFVSYEGTYIRAGRSLLATVPSAEARVGDFSRERVNLNRIFDPTTTTGSGADAIRLPFAGNVIPRSRWDPVSEKVLALYPMPNVPGQEYQNNNYFRSPSDPDDSRQLDFRIDHSFSANDRVFYRHSFRRQNVLNNSALPLETGACCDDGGQRLELKGDNLTMNWTHTFSPTIYNEARFGFTQFPTRFNVLLLEPLNAKFGIKNAPGDSFGDGLNYGLTHFQITPERTAVASTYNNLGSACCWPNTNNMDSIHVADNLLVQRGTHGLRVGMDFRRANVFRNAGRRRRGRFIFTRVYTTQSPNVAASRTTTGNELGDLILGYANQASVGNPAGENYISPSWAFYLQDDWKVTRNLTLNLGLRWDYFGMAYYPNGTADGFGGVSTYLTEYSGVPKDDPRYGTFLRPKDGSDTGAERDLNNFAPRIGLAYRLGSKTVIRSAFGIIYGQAEGVNSRWSNQTPFFTEVEFPGTNTVPAAFVKDGLPFVQLPAKEPVAGTGINTSPLKIPNQYASQWFFDIQREVPGGILFNIGYQGTKTTKIVVSRNINFPGPHPTIPAAQRRLDPKWNAINRGGDAGANANYNALTVRAEKRYAQGLTFLASYTWSHNIDQATESLDTNFDRIANPYDLRNERGNSNLDHRHMFLSSVTYELPFGRGKAYGASWNRAVDAFLGGWQAGGILTLRSGFPFDVTYPGDPQNTGTTNRGNRVGVGTVSNPTIDRWFDELAFVQSAPGVYGNAGRNLLFGPGTRNLDFSLAKRFSGLREGHYLQLRFEAFNLSNTPKFGQPNATLRQPNTATINRADEPRRIQIGLKYVF
jgi:hypothetical protein